MKEPFQIETLSKREEEILALVLLGLTNVEIAEKCFIAEGTVKTHVQVILRKKLESRGRMGLVVRKIQELEKRIKELEQHGN